MSIQKRFEEIKKSIYKGNQKAFADAIGVAPSVIANVLGSRQGNPSFDVVSKICANANISAEWLLTGDGPMLKSTKSVPPTAEINIINDDFVLNNNTVPLYDINASAGFSKMLATGGELLGTIQVPDIPRSDGAVHVIGDSMYPLLKAGDIIGFRTINSLDSITYGEIYILQLDHDNDTSVVVKYIKKADDNPDNVRLVSYNKEHDTQDVPRNWISAIARVTFSIRKWSF